jgi:hypothetical protein
MYEAIYDNNNMVLISKTAKPPVRQTIAGPVTVSIRHTVVRGINAFCPFPAQFIVSAITLSTR